MDNNCDLHFISRSGASFTAAGQKSIPPDPAMMIRALRQIGYSFEQAISDLVDNSVSANASEVLIRFIVDETAVRSLAVADNGEGMTSARLSEAMRFGSETDISRRTLGKFGMGMKLASLSHAQTVTVMSSSAGDISGRRWSVNGIGMGWSCAELSTSDARSVASAPWGGLRLLEHGTVVLWDEIDKLPTGSRGLRDLIRNLQRRLEVHLGLTFHRFLEGTAKGPRLRIFLDLQQAGGIERMHQVEVRPLNPFDYRETGHPDYPQTFRVQIDPSNFFEAEAHIWPANSESEAYKLGNRAAARQGFYFYRHDRLIQAGGWNGLVQSDSEPHSSLARICIDLPESLDQIFGLNVQKSSVITPPTFLAALESARSDKGRSIDEFRSSAQAVYRKTDQRAQKDLPLIPGRGMPIGFSRLVTQKQAPDGAGRTVDINWSDLSDPSAVFEIDRIERRIILNRRLRAGLSENHDENLNLLKACLYLLLQDEIDNERVSAARKNRLEFINKALAQVLRI